MKILVIRFSSIGDIVLTSPVLRCLHQQIGAEVHFLTKPSFASINKASPYVSKVWTTDQQDLIPSLKKERFDHIVDLHHNLRSLKIKLGLSRPATSFHKANLEKWLMVNFKINRLPNTHIVDRYMNTVRRLGAENDGKGLDFFISPKDEEKGQIFIEQFAIPKSYLALVLGAQHATKVPLLEQYQQFIHTYNGHIVLIGGPNEVQIANQILLHDNISNSVGKLTIGSSAYLVKHAEWVLTPDTGMMHIAAAFDRNIVSIWGNTTKELGMYPYIPNHTENQSIIIENQNVKCRPCSKIGYPQCPKGHFDCMKSHDFKVIANRLNQGKIDING